MKSSLLIALLFPSLIYCQVQSGSMDSGNLFLMDNSDFFDSLYYEQHFDTTISTEEIISVASMTFGTRIDSNGELTCDVIDRQEVMKNTKTITTTITETGHSIQIFNESIQLQKFFFTWDQKLFAVLYYDAGNFQRIEMYDKENVMYEIVKFENGKAVGITKKKDWKEPYVWGNWEIVFRLLGLW